MKSILDKSFTYTPSYATDIRVHFAAIREQQKREQGQTAADTGRVLSIFERRRIEAKDERR